MSRTYKTVMVLAGLSAAIVAIAYLVANQMAPAIGPAGIQIPAEVSRLCIAWVATGAIVSAVAWVVDRAHRESAERDIRPLIRAEVERAVAATSAALAEQVGQQIAAGLEPKIRRVADVVASRAVAGLREIATGEIWHQQIDAALKRAQAYGMVRQAQAGANGRSRVVALPSMSGDEN